MISKIKINHELSFNELCERLRNVSLRGFPDVKIYADSPIEVRPFSPAEIRRRVFTPQPSVYTPLLGRVSHLAELFSAHGINIFSLSGGYDYSAVDEDSEVTDWTLIPPVIESFQLKFDFPKGVDYSSSIGARLFSLMREKSYALNPELQHLTYPEFDNLRGCIAQVLEICDGSHRVEAGFRRGLEQNLLVIDSPAHGFPYYAAPKPYSLVHEETDNENSDKTHILTSPGHKMLYRVFPSGGILSGTVRPPTAKEKFD